tara:strand:+ start:2224 stop:3306 length:1083 start_codon:yes stop_codon:yes gene_type:complete
MTDLIVSCPINDTSIGNVSVNILRELWKEGVNIALFPVQNNIDLSVYDKLPEEFKNWINLSAQNKFKKLKKDTPALQIWHINGSQARMSTKSFLYTFYETSKPTLSEINICKTHEKVFFSSSYSRDLFLNCGVDNAKYIPLGFDNDFHESKRLYLEDVVHFSLLGKFEKRKNTASILRSWAKHFGNDPKFHLSCAIMNKFIPAEDLNHAIGQALSGEVYQNINFLPFIPSNSEYNTLLNSIDIDLTGLSGGEGWNLPAFNATCLGKWSCVLDCTSHKDWANQENSILVEPNGKQNAEDGVFFKDGAEFNQGEFYTFDEDQMTTTFVKAISKHKQKNTQGQKLKDEFSYKNSVKQIVNHMT